MVKNFNDDLKRRLVQPKTSVSQKANIDSSTTDNGSLERENENSRSVGEKLGKKPKENLNTKLLRIKEYGINLSGNLGIPLKLFENVFEALVQSQPTDEQLESRINIYSKGVEACIEHGHYIYQYTNAFVALVQSKPTDEQLKIYSKGLEACKEHGHDPRHYTNAFVDLVQSKPTPTVEQLNIYSKGLEACKIGHRPSDYTNAFIALVQSKPTDEQLKIYSKGLEACKEHRHSPDYYTNAFVALVKTEEILPSVNIGLRNFGKTLEDKLSINANDFRDALLDLLRITYEELHMKGFRDEKEIIRSLLDGHVPRYPRESNKYSSYAIA